MKSRQTKKIIIISIAIFVICVAVYYYYLSLILRGRSSLFIPDSSTTTTMYIMKRKVLHYAKEKNKLPKTVEDLPYLEGFSNSNTDSWGHVINMHINGSEVTLSSLGKDNKPGGKKSNLDLVAIFDAKTKNGSWANEDEEGYPSWKQLPNTRANKSDY